MRRYAHPVPVYSSAMQNLSPQLAPLEGRIRPIGEPGCDPIEQVRRLIDVAPHLPFRLNQLSSWAGYSRYHFLRLFQQRYRATPHQYLVRRRIERAKSLLSSVTNTMTVTEVCLAVGFQSLGSFSALFCREVGESPTSFQARWHVRPPVFVPMCVRIEAGLM